MTFAVDEELREVPLDLISEDASFFSLEKLIEWVSSVSIYIELCKERKCHTEVELTDRFHSFISFWLLVHKLVTWESEYHDIIV